VSPEGGAYERRRSLDLPGGHLGRRPDEDADQNTGTSKTRTGVGTASDLTGFLVEARDGSIGKMDEATDETNGSFRQRRPALGSLPR
jgi:hypothetical protein